MPWYTDDHSHSTPGYLFSIWFSDNVLFNWDIFVWNGYKLNIQSALSVNTDGLVLQHQGINSHSAEYAPIHFQLFMH